MPRPTNISHTKTITTKLIAPRVTIKQLGLVHYVQTLSAMRDYANFATQHQLWIVEHPPVYSLGQRQSATQFIQIEKCDHLAIGHIDSVQSDRGGLTTYHGPGQVVFYCLFHLPSLYIGVKQFVYSLEQSVIAALNELDIAAHRIEGKPGVYIDNRKVASLGVKVTRGWSYHGIACNFATNLAPFSAIDPCGWRGLQMCNVIDYAAKTDKQAFIQLWRTSLCQAFGMTEDAEIIADGEHAK